MDFSLGIFSCIPYYNPVPFACEVAASRLSVCAETRTMSQSSPKITAYLKTFCGWSEGVRAIMRKYDLPYEEKDIIKNPAFRWEMEQRSGQSLSPCVEIDGHMLADISGEEVEKWLIENDRLQQSDITPDAPINSSCTDEQHEAMALGRLPVPGKIRFLD
jgi:glutaredoxin